MMLLAAVWMLGCDDPVEPAPRAPAPLVIEEVEPEKPASPDPSARAQALQARLEALEEDLSGPQLEIALELQDRLRVLDLTDPAPVTLDELDGIRKAVEHLERSR